LPKEVVMNTRFAHNTSGLPHLIMRPAALVNRAVAAYCCLVCFGMD
jgi:hypothetical protein